MDSTELRIRRTEAIVELRRASQRRGLVLGLAVGEALARQAPGPATGPLACGVGAQLAAFTIEGLIRAHVRGSLKGLCHPPSVIWHAYCRWGFLQGIEPTALRRRWAGSERWPDGWLSSVRTLEEQRGNAPTMVRSLERFAAGTEDRPVEHGTLEEPATDSRGAHALVRSLPVAITPDSGAGWGANEEAELAALTHSPAIAPSVVFGVRLARTMIQAEQRPLSVTQAIRRLVDTRTAVPGSFRRLADAVETTTGAEVAATGVRMRRDAESVLSFALATTARFPRPDLFTDAVSAAMEAADAPNAAAVVGAIFGAREGFEVIPPDLIARLDLGWVLDTLVADYQTTVEVSPEGSDMGGPRDPYWFERYPGW